MICSVLLAGGTIALIYLFPRLTKAVPGSLVALGAIDSLLTSVVADNLTKTRHDSNRELWGQGVGNIGYPAPEPPCAR